MKKNFILIMSSILFVAHAASASYMECKLYGGPISVARIMTDANSLGVTIINDQDGPISFLDGRTGDSVQMETNQNSGEFTLSMKTSYPYEAQATAWFYPVLQNERYYDIHITLQALGEVTENYGRCMIIAW